jgi:hypothetical protein
MLNNSNLQFFFNERRKDLLYSQIACIANMCAHTVLHVQNCVYTEAKSKVYDRGIKSTLEWI